MGEVGSMKKDVDVKMIIAGVTMTVSIIKLVIQEYSRCTISGALNLMLAINL